MIALFCRAAARSARDSLRANLVPALLLQAVAVLIVASYYGSGPSREVWDGLALWKQRGGVAFSAISTAFFAGLLPWLLSCLSRGIERDGARHLPWLLFFWGAMGVLIDSFYSLQAHIFGNDARALTIALKVAVDEFVFSPLLSLPLISLAFAWKDADYNMARLSRILGPRPYQTRVVPLLGPGWAIWIPAIAMVYSLPLALQLPIANLVQCLWSLLLLFLTQPARDWSEAS